MRARQRIIVGLVAAYAVALVTLVVSRLVLNLAADLQFLLPCATSLLTFYVVSDARTVARRGGRLVANGAVILAALLITSVVRQSRPDDWPVVAIGLILPLFYVAQLAIDWRPQAEISA